MKNKIISVILFVLALISLSICLFLFFTGTYTKEIWALNATIISFILVPVLCTIGFKLILKKNEE